MTLPDEVRAHARQVVASARRVRIVPEAIDAVAEAWSGAVEDPGLDPARHYLEGPPDAVAMYLLTLDAINFGSGWFPTLRKRPGMSGYFTVAASLTDRFRAEGPWSAEELRAMTTREIAGVLGQAPGSELMALYAQALRQLGTFLGTRTALEVVATANGSAAELARLLATSMSMWNDIGFYKRAQIVANDLQAAGVASFRDLDTLTIFADNLVPHVLRCDGVLVYDEALAEIIDAERRLEDVAAEREIRASAVHACVILAERLGVPERVLDVWLWNRGQAPEYKSRPRHRARSVFY
jgi:hypothetical protein